MPKNIDGKLWLKARLLFAPVWIAEVENIAPWVRPRGIFGFLLLPLAEVFTISINMALSAMDPNHLPHFQFQILEDHRDELF